MKAVVFALFFAALGATAFATEVRDKGEIKCVACETVVTLVDNWLDQGKTHDEIKRLVSQLCSYVGPSYADICTALLDGELEQIIKYIETMEPKKVCQMIKLCPVGLTNSAVTCSVCKVVVDALEMFVEDPRTEQQIINMLDRLCKMFPKYESVCDQLVAYGVMEVVELIKQYGDSEKVCTIIKLC